MLRNQGLLQIQDIFTEINGNRLDNADYCTPGNGGNSTTDSFENRHSVESAFIGQHIN